MATPAPIKRSGIALVVEDQAEVRAGLVERLLAVFPDFRIVETASIRTARQWLDETTEAEQLNIALVDLGLPDGNGVEVVAMLARRCPAAIPVVATVYDDDNHLFDALSAGAQGYILKDANDADLEASLRAIARGEPALSPSIAQRILRHFHQRPATRVDDGILTARESEVLGWLGRGLTVRETARKLGLTEHTTASYVKLIYSKLNISKRAEAALEAQRRGLV